MTSHDHFEDPSDKFMSLAGALAEVLASLEGQPIAASMLMAADDLAHRIQRTTRPSEASAGQGSTQGTVHASNRRLDILTEAMPQIVWSTLPDGFHDYYNARWYEFTGTPVGSTDGDGWAGLFHPDDQEQAWALWRHSLATGEPYEVDYRLRHHSGEYRWTVGRALPIRDARGAITRWIGTCTDIEKQKRAVENNELLTRELSHRIKNIFAIINGLVMMSARKTPEVLPFAHELQDRLAALGRAHQFVQPQSDPVDPAMTLSTLHAILRELFAPYPDMHERFQIEGDDVPIDDKGATPVSLIFHELATNAAKYGALSVHDGRVDIITRLEGDELKIAWAERGGPPVEGPPGQTCFGSRLIKLSAEQQLGGKIERQWAKEGLEVEVMIRASGLVHASG